MSTIEQCLAAAKDGYSIQWKGTDGRWYNVPWFGDYRTNRYWYSNCMLYRIGTKL